MPRDPAKTEPKSTSRRAFDLYLRTGRRLAGQETLESQETLERKFNPYHDPRNGQFTFAPGGPRSVANPIFSDQRGLWKSKQPLALASPRKKKDAPYTSSRMLERAAETRTATLELNRYPTNPRARIGNNGGPRLYDPKSISEAIPSLRNSPAASIIAIPAEVFGLTGPAREAITALHDSYVRSLVNQIKALDPRYYHPSLAQPTTAEARVNQINGLRFDRAVAMYRVRGDESALQVEVLRFLQRRVDAAYDDAVSLYENGRLPPGYSRNHAIGNYIDMRVRRELQEQFNIHGIDHTSGPVRVAGRQYDTSGPEPKFVVPDARVGLGYYDWTLEPKRPGGRQLRGFFASDLKPNWTIIVRPTQIGAGHSYIIKNPRR